MRSAVLFYGLLAAAALGWNAWSGHPWAFASEASQAAGVRWLRDGALGLGCAALILAVSELVTHRTRWGQKLAAELGAAIGPLSLSQCLVLAALSGFAEEALFRGALQPRIGWALASLLFGIVHWAPQPALRPWSAFAVVAGGLFGGLYALTGNLLAPVLAHAGVNAVNLVLLSRRFGAPAPRSEDP